MSSYCCCWWRWAFDLMDCLGIGHGHERDQQRNVNRVLPPAGMMIPFVDSFVSLTGVHVRFFCIAAGGRSSSSPRVARLLLVRSPIAILMLHTASQAQLHSSLYIPSTTSWFDYIMYRNSNILFSSPQSIIISSCNYLDSFDSPTSVSNIFPQSQSNIADRPLLAIDPNFSGFTRSYTP